jgi:SAM-dependent methyltransferase
MSSRQKGHYENIHSEYEKHYYDPISISYRDRFIYDPLFAGLEMNGLRIADLACGSGNNSLAVLSRFPQSEVEGFDISARACEAYRKTVGRPAHEVDLTSGIEAGEPFDAAMIVGGLHHCVADLPGALSTIAGLLKPGGLFLLVEPNRQFFLDSLRRLWYRMDRYFDHLTEEPLDHDRVLEAGRAWFAGRDVRYLGGPGYVLILNSLLFRMPGRIKAAIATPLVAVDDTYNRLPGSAPFAYFIARWQRK